MWPPRRSTLGMTTKDMLPGSPQPVAKRAHDGRLRETAGHGDEAVDVVAGELRERNACCRDRILAIILAKQKADALAVEPPNLRDGDERVHRLPRDRAAGDVDLDA